MITVDSKFYESGCTMDGKENRVFLKSKNGKANMRLIFVRDKVRITAAMDLLDMVVPFKDIERIGILEKKSTGELLPTIMLKE